MLAKSVLARLGAQWFRNAMDSGSAWVEHNMLAKLRHLTSNWFFENGVYQYFPTLERIRCSSISGIIEISSPLLELACFVKITFTLQSDPAKGEPVPASLGFKLHLKQATSIQTPASRGGGGGWYDYGTTDSDDYKCIIQNNRSMLLQLQWCTGIYMHIYPEAFTKKFEIPKKHIYPETAENVGLHIKLHIYLIKKHIYAGVKK